MLKRITTIALLWMFAAGGLAAADLERRAKVLETKLIAPCCYSQQVSLHQSPAAEEIRRDIRRRLAAGESDDQILNAYVAQYGQRILAEPPAQGLGSVLYVSPIVAFLVSAAFLFVIVRRISTRPASAPVPAPHAMNTAALNRLEQRLTDQLRDLD